MEVKQTELFPAEVLYELPSIPQYLRKKDKTVTFTTYKNEEKTLSLLEDVIWKLWAPYFMQYLVKKKEVVDDEVKCKTSLKPVYDVMEAILNSFTEDATLNIDRALAKLYEERKIIFSGKWYEESGKKWFHRPDFKTRAGAQALTRLGLTKYEIPTVDDYPDYPNIGWTLESFSEFNETFRGIFHRKIGKNNDIYERAYKHLERVDKERGLTQKNYSLRE